MSYDITEVFEQFKSTKGFAELTKHTFASQFHELELIQLRVDNKRHVVLSDQVMDSENDDTTGFVGEMLVQFKNAGDYFLNELGSVHGGALSTWVDIITTQALICLDKKGRIRSVSVRLKLDFESPALPNSDLYFRTKVEKIGKSLAFTSCKIEDREGKVLAIASHVKAFLPEPKM